MSCDASILTLSCRDFCDQVLKLSEPALISEGLKGSPAVERWSPATLRSANAGRFVDVQVSTSGHWKFGPLADPKEQYVLRNVPFETACDWITSSGEGDPKYYIPHLNMSENFSGLLTDLNFPISEDPPRVQLWVGSAGTVTPLHCDIDNNLFGQIYGSKTVTLFSPEETSFLYQFPVGSVTPHLSFVDVERPDLAKYPLYRNARMKTVTILPGQLLFIPAGWWHHVRSVEISISVNQWLMPTLIQRAGASLLWLLISEYKRDRWAQLLERHQMSVAALLNTADKLVLLNPCAAALAAATVLDNSKIPQDGDPKIAPQVSAIRNLLEELLVSVCQRPPAVISPELVSEVIKSIRHLLDRVGHSTQSSFGGS